MERTWEISDIVTLAQYRAELDARKVHTAKIAAAWRAGDIKGIERAQRVMRAEFAK